MPRILSLDTEPEVLELLHTILVRAGYEHLYTTDNEEALAILRKGGIDLFTQNILHYDLNGCKFYQMMQSESSLKNIPVLLITSLDPTTLSSDYFKMIAPLYPKHYISMPFGPKKLLSAVETTLKG